MEKENLFQLAEDALNRGDFDEAEAILNQIEEEADKIEDVIEANTETVREDETAETEVREDNETEVAETSEEETVEEETTEEPDNEAEEIVDNKNNDEEIVEEEEQTEMKELSNQVKRDEVREFGQAVKTKNFREFTTVEGEVLIPEEVLALVKTPSDVIDLRKYVNVLKTKTGAGKVPVLSRSNAKMNTVAELAANPELATPALEKITFEIDTYRGYIPVSQEVIDDADYDVAGLIAEHINDLALNTVNAAIAGVLKGFTAKTAADLDDLKTILNVDLKAGYRRQIVMSQSALNAIDVMKDLQGRYILQQDITAASGYKLFGHEVIVVEDTMLGEAGEAKLFVGDLKRAVAFVDRKQVSVRWKDHDVYGEMLMGAIRFDAVEADADAGFFVTLGEAGSEEEDEEQQG